MPRSLRSITAACLLAGAPACRSAAPTQPPEPGPSPAPTRAAPPQAPRERTPDQVVAVVDGVEIREADVSRLARLTSTGPDAPPPPRATLVLQLVERALVAREAAVRGVTVGDPEVDAALRAVAGNVGLTLEQLPTAVTQTTALSWQEYREEIAAQLLEMRLVIAAMPWAGPSELGVSSAASDEARFAATRARVLGCLRAGAKVSLEDDVIELPANPFAIEASLAGVRFDGDPGVPVADLEAAATAASTGQPLCDALPAAEIAMTQVYLDRGHLDGRVRIPWPAEPRPAMTVVVDAVAGPRHVIGELAFDQSAVPKAEHLRESNLRRKLAALAEAGEVASMPKLQAITEAVRSAFEDAGVGPVTVEVARQPRGEVVRVDLTFRVAGGEV